MNTLIGGRHNNIPDRGGKVGQERGRREYVRSAR